MNRDQARASYILSVNRHQSARSLKSDASRVAAQYNAAMRLSPTDVYAFKALAYHGTLPPDTLASSDAIASATDVPKPYLVRLLAILGQISKWLTVFVNRFRVTRVETRASCTRW